MRKTKETIEQKKQDTLAAGSFHSENFRRRSRYIFVFLLLICAFFAITILNINTGSVHIPVPKILHILFTMDGSVKDVDIIWRIRLPRVIMAAVLGGALALSGFLLQTFFENPIAGPYVWESRRVQRWWSPW